LRASVLLEPQYRGDQFNRYNMILNNIQLPVAPMLGIRYFVFSKEKDPNNPDPPDPGRPTFQRLAFTEGLGLWEMQGVPGFAYLSDIVDAVSDEQSAQNWMKSLTWDKVRAYPAMVEAPASAIAGIARPTDGSSPGA